MSRRHSSGKKPQMSRTILISCVAFAALTCPNEASQNVTEVEQLQRLLRSPSQARSPGGPNSTNSYSNHRMTDYEVVRAITPPLPQQVNGTTPAGVALQKDETHDISRAESLLRPQVAVQIYTSPGALANESSIHTVSSGGVTPTGTSHRLQSASLNRLLLKRRRGEPEDLRGREVSRDYQPAPSRAVGLWQYDSDHSEHQQQQHQQQQQQQQQQQYQQQRPMQSLDLHQLDGNTFTLAGPLINAVITVPGHLPGVALGETGEQQQKRSISARSSPVESEEMEEQLARNISALNVERAIAHLLDSQASGNLEFNMNMNGDEIVINPVGRRAHSLLETSLPALANQQGDNQLLGMGGENVNIRQSSRDALPDTENSDTRNQLDQAGRVNKRYARLIKGLGSGGGERRLGSSRRRMFDQEEEKLPVSSENVDTMVEEGDKTSSGGNNFDDLGDDDEDDGPSSASSTKRQDEEESDSDSEQAPPARTAKSVARKFKSSQATATRSASQADKGKNSEAQAQGFDDEERVNSADRAMTRATNRLPARTSANGEAGALRGRNGKRRRSQPAARGSDGAERAPSSAYDGGRGNSRRSQQAAPVGGSDDNPGQPTVLIKGEDVRRFERLLENLRSLSMVKLSAEKPRARASKIASARPDNELGQVGESGGLAAHHSHNSRDPSPSKRMLQHRSPGSAASQNQDGCERRKRAEQRLAQQESSESAGGMSDPSSDSENTDDGNERSPSAGADSNSDSEEGRRNDESNEESGGGDESQAANSSGGTHSSSGSRREEEVGLDESDSNLSRSKAAYSEDVRGPPKAIYVRKTILQSYYDENKQHEGNKFEPEVTWSSSDNRQQERQGEGNAEQAGRGSEGLNQSGAEDGVYQPASTKQRAGGPSDKPEARQATGGRDPNAYIDYNRLDDREVYRGSESQKQRSSMAPMTQQGQGSRYLEQGRASDGKIPYATVEGDHMASTLSIQTAPARGGQQSAKVSGSKPSERSR